MDVCFGDVDLSALNFPHSFTGSSQSSMSLKEQILAQFEDETTLGFNEIRKDSQYLALFAEEPRWLHTVELFCFGEYSDYNTTDYIELTPAALFKLRKLTMASECLKQNVSISSLPPNQLLIQRRPSHIHISRRSSK